MTVNVRDNKMWALEFGFLNDIRYENETKVYSESNEMGHRKHKQAHSKWNDPPEEEYWIQR